MAVVAEDPCPWAGATADGSARRWRRGGLVALAALATASIVLASSMLGHSGNRGSATEMMGIEAAEMANPVSAPTYNSGEGMTYMPSTQSGVSDTDQSPEISQSFLDDEAKAKKHMKKLAKMLKKSAKEDDALNRKVLICFVI